MIVSYKLEAFEGPLDLLLHLIDQNELDIYDIPIREITDQYVAYVKAMHDLELGITSEFLVMAATLLSIKSKMLLPKPQLIDEDIDDALNSLDPRTELIQKLIEYRKFKLIAEMLRDKEMERSLLFTREPEDLSPYLQIVPVNPVEGLETSDLFVIFQRMLRRMTSRQIVSKIRRDEISVKDRMIQMVTLLQSQGGKILFSTFIPEQSSREEIVVTFLALLELIKVKKIAVFQHQLFDDIVIHEK